jgi:heat-inducible transcriptional repressor
MTPRQKQLLAAIISEFIETANAVGSVSLNDKYHFNVSPATIRNEMAALVREGYLDKPHSSAGRVPTTLGLRTFVEELMDETEDMDVVTKTQVRQKFHESRFNKDDLMRTALQTLTRISGNPAVALIGSEIYYAGLSDMLDLPEFQEIDNLKALMRVLEDYSKLSAVFNHHRSDDEVQVLIGEETELDELLNYAVVFSELRLHGGRNGYIAVIGPNRMPYNRIIPAVKYIAETISSVVKGW